MGKSNKTATKKKNKGDTLFKRRVFATVGLVIVAGLLALSAFVWTKDTKADTAFDPFFNLNSSSPKVRIFQPLQQSLDNPANLVANGQAPPNSTVTLKVDNTVVGTATANDKGLWSRNVSGLTDGDHELTASAVVNGPLSVVTSHQFAPGFGMLDLQTSSITSSYATGVSALFFSYTSRYGGADPVSTYTTVAPQNRPYIYVVRDRSIMVVDIATQKPIKTINLGERFALGEGQYSDQSLRAVSSGESQNRMYLLFSNSGSSQILAVNTINNTLVSQSDFNPSVQPALKNMILANGKLYIQKESSESLQAVDLSNANVENVAFQNNVMSIAATPDGNNIYIAEASNENGDFSVSKLTTGDGSVESQVINLGSSFGAERMSISPSGQRLYTFSPYSSDMRTFNLEDNTEQASVNVQATPALNTSTLTPIFNTNGSRMYVPLQDGRVAMVDTQNTNLIAHINLPGQNYSSLSGVMYFNDKIYTTYTRVPSPADITNAAQVFSSIGISNANSSTSVVPQTVGSTGSTTTTISQPIAITPQTYTGKTQFSVGTPLSITSPATNGSLPSSNPLIKGKGPKNKIIQLIVNTNTPIDVTVDGSGNWERQVTLPKDKFSKVTVAYNNKRTQVVVPNQAIFGPSITKSELSVIDGASALQQQGINLGDLGVQNVKINNAAAINPNGQRYYVISNDATSLVSTLLGALTGEGGSESIDFQSVLNQLPTTQVGSIGVYSAQTRQLTDTIQLPAGMAPLGITISPDGKKAAVTVLDIPKEFRLVSGQEPIDESTPAPFNIYFLNLDQNTIDGDPIEPNINLSAFMENGVEAEQALQTYFSIGSGIYFLSRPGNFNGDGTKFYTSGFASGKFTVVDMASRQVSSIDLPAEFDYSVVLNTQYNKNNKVLYATYLNVVPPTEGSGLPQFTTGVVLFNTSNNQIIGQSALPNFPLFNFAVSPSGTQLYFITANIQSFIETLSSTESNPFGLLADTLPQFSIGTYDLNAGTYNSYPLTNTEVPISAALSSDGSRLFVPTLASNVVHVFDTATNQVDPGNAPVVLPGLSLMFGTTDFLNDTTIGAYTASSDYYVPADAVTIPTGGGGQTVVQNNVVGAGGTQFRFLPAAQQAAIAPQSITIPKQTVQTIQKTVEKTIEQQKNAQVEKTKTIWLIYVFYMLLGGVLTAIGVAVWRTDMVLGRGATEGLFS